MKPAHVHFITWQIDDGWLKFKRKDINQVFSRLSLKTILRCHYRSRKTASDTRTPFQHWKWWGCIQQLSCPLHIGSGQLCGGEKQLLSIALVSASLNAFKERLPETMRCYSRLNNYHSRVWPLRTAINIFWYTRTTCHTHFSNILQPLSFIR